VDQGWVAAIAAEAKKNRFCRVGGRDRTCRQRVARSGALESVASGERSPQSPHPTTSARRWTLAAGNRYLDNPPADDPGPLTGDRTLERSGTDLLTRSEDGIVVADATLGPLLAAALKASTPVDTHRHRHWAG